MASLVLFSGPPGVGKSTLAYHVAKKTGWAVISRDQIDRSLELHNIHHDLVSYEILLGLAELNLKNTISIILDAVFPRHVLRLKAEQLAEKYGAEFCPIVCTCSNTALWRKRVQARPKMVEGWTPVNWDEVRRVNKYYEDWSQQHLTVDAAQSLDENYNKILHYLSVIQDKHSWFD